MLSRFQFGTIAEFKAGEEIANNDVYILDPITREIRKPRDCDEWLTCQLVYVNNVSFNNTINFCISKGTMCRCWVGYLIL